MKVKKTAIVYHKSDLDGVVSAAIATMYENSKDRIRMKMMLRKLPAKCVT